MNGPVAGLIGGLVGTFAMSLFEHAASRITNDPRKLARAGAGSHTAQSEPRSHEQPLSSSELLVETVTRKALSRPATPTERERLGTAVHYAFGATAGALYGALADRNPMTTLGGGMLYGLAVLLVADELALPAMTLAPKPSETPARLHAYAVGAHLAYGLGLELTRKALASSTE